MKETKNMYKQMAILQERITKTEKAKAALVAELAPYLTNCQEENIQNRILVLEERRKHQIKEYDEFFMACNF